MALVIFPGFTPTFARCEHISKSLARVFEKDSLPVSKITPVPGGVGPMTIAMLLQNTVTAAEMQNKIG